MSAEKNLMNVENNLNALGTLEKNKPVLSGRVDINVLLNRARKIKAKETQTNLVFIGLTFCLIIVAGLILSF